MAAAIVAVAVPVTAEERRVRVALVCDAGSPEAGSDFALGVLFEPDPGWHIYWRNPGASGLATEVRFELAPGFEAGEVQWPAPVFFEQPGGLVGYGYDRPVVLAAIVRPPADAPAQTTVTLAASWLACRDRCVFESAELTAELPLGGTELERGAAALAGWRGSVPVMLEDPPFSISVSAGPLPETGAGELVVWLSWSGTPREVEFFPDPGPDLKVEASRAMTRGTLTRVNLRVARMKASASPSESFPAVVSYRTPDGRPRAVIVDIDIE